MRTIKELEEEIKVLKDTVAILILRIEHLETKNVQLEAENLKLKTKSDKSNKPPSSDGYSKKNVKNGRTKSEKKSGGQGGHEGKTLEKVEEVDMVIELKPIPTKCECGGNIVVETEDFIVRQVIDVSMPKKTIIEYRQYRGICDICGKINKQDFPDNVTNTAVYGDNLKAIITYLNQYQLLPLKRTTELVKDLLGISISQATVISATKEAHGKLSGFEKSVKEHLVSSEVVHFDETGMRVGGRLNWLHVAGTKGLTLYTAHKKRGKEAMDAMGVLPHLTGVAVHDHLKSYYKYDNCAHAECNAHILRYLLRLSEDLNYVWAGEMKDLLLKMKRHTDLCKVFGVTKIETREIKAYETAYNRILDAARVENVNKASVKTETSRKKSESELLANRLLAYNVETLSFLYDFNIPFDNNLAERDLRMPKAKQKISGCFRTKEGADVFARVRSAISTIKKNGKSVLDGLIMAFGGEINSFLGWQQ